MRNGVALIALLLTAFISFDAFARQDGAPARALGMSDAVRALDLVPLACTSTAAMSQAVQYAIDTGYGYRNWASRHNFHLHWWTPKPTLLLAPWRTLTQGEGRMTA